MNITLDSSVKAVDFNGTDISEVKFNGTSVWKKPAAGQIFGASWDGSSSTVLTRTDASAGFANPDPYVADGNHPGASPFDNIMPWSGMAVETIDDNVLVKIPKFWYKITTGTGNAISFQIANYPADGFNVSPAHQDRGDGVGERDFIYVGRYHSISERHRSKRGSQPVTNNTRSTSRYLIKINLGTGFYLWDYAALVTIWLLYIVEFANWDSQTCIGYGCGNNNAKQTTGASDLMPYHTGTMQTSRTAYGVGCQYRGIEDLWGNVYDWVDGIRFSVLDIYLYKNPSEFDDSSGGVNTGTRPNSSGTIISWKQPSATGYDWAIYPGAVDGTASTHVSDNCYYNSSGRVLYAGGYYSRSKSYGLFCMSGYGTDSDSFNWVGARIMYLPS